MKLLKARIKVLLTIFSAILAILSISFGIQTFGGGEKVVIGAKNCTEQHILAEIFSQLIERETDIKVIRKFNLEGTTICFNALKSRAIDLYIEYTGTAILDILKEPIPSCDLFDYVKEAFQEKYGILWLDRLGFSNQYALVAHRDSSLKKISDLEKHQELKVAYDPEFAARLEPKLLKEHYCNTSYHQLMDQVLLYFSLGSRAVDIISGFSTDGKLADPQFVVLEDDRGAFPTYEAAPMITEKCLHRHPNLIPVLKKLCGAISTKTMSELNFRVEICEEKVVDVASDFLNHLNR